MTQPNIDFGPDLLEVRAETSITFEIKLRGKDYLLRQSGGDWYLNGKWIGGKRTSWVVALARSLEQAEKKVIDPQE